MSHRCPPLYALAALGVVACAACEDAGPRTRASGVTDTVTGAADPVVDSLQAEAERLYAEGSIQEAAPVLEQAISTARRGGDTASLARALTWLAQASWRLGDYERTRSHGEEALRLKLASDDGEDLFRSYNVLGLLAWNESRPFDAVELFAHAREAAAMRSDTADLAKVSNNLGLVQLSLGNYAEARDGFETARRAASSLGDRRIEGRVLINLGNLDLETGRFRSAVEHFEAARPLLRAAGDAIGEQVLLGHLGTALRAVGDPRGAREHLEQALETARADGLRQEEAINLEQLAELYRDAGDYREALRLFAEARSINEELGLVDELAIDLRSEAAIHATLGDTLLALQKVRQALRTHEEIGFPFERIRDLIAMAELASGMGWADSAAAYLAAAEPPAEEMGTPSARLTVGLGRARIARDLDRPDEVLAAIDEIAADLAGGGEASRWEAAALRAWAEASRGRLEAAIAAGREAITAIERTRSNYASSALRTTHLSARDRVYAEHVTTLLAAGEPREAFWTADRMRARSLLEHLAAGPDRGRAGAAATDILEGTGQLQRAHDLGQIVEEIETSPPEWRTEDSDEQLARLRAERRTSLKEYESAMRRAEQRDPLAVAILGRGTGDVTAVIRALHPDEALLEYLVRPDHVLIFVLTRDTLDYVRVPVSRATLASRVRVARSAAGAADGDPSAVLERLYDVLIAPVVETRLLTGAERLFVVPHAELTYVPFAALLDRRSGRFLVEDYLVGHLPSAGVLPLLRTNRRSTALSVAAFAPTPDELPASLSELAAIGQAIDDAVLYEGAAATEDRVRRDFASKGAVHLAAHGRLNGTSPLYSRIELAPGAGGAEDDGRLEVVELLDLRIRSRVVYLSGCATAIGPAWADEYSRGEDYATLSRAFLFAGADAVIATLWSIEDEGAALFASGFYAAARDTDLLSSLGRAQRRMIRDPRFSAPYYWAAYRLTGRGELRLGAQ